MKKIRLSFWAMAICLGWPAGVVWAEAVVPQITAAATAEAKAGNDSVRITLAVTFQSRLAHEAVAENNAKAREIIRVLKNLATGAQLGTSHFTLQPQYDYQRQPPRLTEYQAYHSVEAVLEGLTADELANRASKIIEAGLQAGANRVENTFFYLQNRGRLENQVLAQATQAAAERSKILAEAAGVKLKRLISLTPDFMETPQMFQGMRAAGAVQMEKQDLAPPLEAGETKITAMVTMAYEIQ